jgi:hypothetical protein
MPNYVKIYLSGVTKRGIELVVLIPNHVFIILLPFRTSWVTFNAYDIELLHALDGFPVKVKAVTDSGTATHVK